MPSRSCTLLLYVLLRLLFSPQSMEPSVSAWKTISWRCRHQHQPGSNIRAFTSETAITVITLTHVQDQSNFLVNGFTFEPPTVPVLLQILSGMKNAWDLVPTGSIYGLQHNKSVELTIPGGVLGGSVSVRTSAVVRPSPFLN